MAIGKKLLVLGAITAFSVAVFAANQNSDSGNGTPKCMPGQKCDTNDENMNGAKRPLKVESIDTMQGTILSVTRVSYPDGTMVHVVLTTPKGDKTFMMGPASFLDQAKMTLQMGDKVSISGYEVNANGSQMWIATRVEKGTNVLDIRQENGQPVWEPTDIEGSPRVNGH
ncbi:MAG: hypothetical protein ACKVOH_04655 [Chlamydiales bacterium]